MATARAAARAATQTIKCAYVEPTRSVPTLKEDITNGLFSDPKTVPPKYFYDDRGSALFDQICAEPEYYPTRTEDALLAARAHDIIGRARPDRILELGSGMSRKTRHLLDACAAHACYPVYVPFDVCDDVVLRGGAQLLQEYEWLDLEPLVGDYTAGLGNLPLGPPTNLVVFLGGTIGNFTDRQALDFLREIRGAMRPGDMLLLGADRAKDPDVLHAAYNDRSRVTACFNLNLLRVLNRELDADFDLDAFQHYAYFNPEASRIEMRLIAMSKQRVSFGHLGRILTIPEGDSILTEISRKFTYGDLLDLLRGSGFCIEQHHEAEHTPFSLVLAQPS